MGTMPEVTQGVVLGSSMKKKMDPFKEVNINRLKGE